MFNISIRTDTPAFRKATYEGDTRPTEIACIMRTVCEQMEVGGNGGVCHDSDGEPVGDWMLAPAAK